MRLLTFLLACLVAGTTLAQAQDRPNVVLILADDLGWVDTELIGETSLYETPNLKRLADRGMTFSNAYAASPICSPTRASILTGQTPARHGMTQPAGHVPKVRYEPETQASGPPHQKCTNVQSVTRLHPSLPTLGKVLKQAGYQTAHFGKWHLGREGHTPLQHGFDIDLPHWYGPGPKTSYLAPWGYTNPAFKEGKPGEHIEDRMAREAVAWLNQRDPAKPFFMNYWQFSVHAPFSAKPELIEHYRKKIKRGEHQQSPTYAAMVHSLDDAVGTLLDALDKEGIADQTVIVFYSDNGGNIHCGLEETDAKGEQYICPITSNHPLRGGKGGIHDGGIRVPAVVVWPGVTKGKTQSDTRIQSTDLYPTILNMLGVDLPKGHTIDGVDFTQALRGEAMERSPMFTYAPYHGNTPQWLPPSMAVHHGDWKLIRTFHYGDDGEHAYRLYNLRDDIGENNNLAVSKPQKVKELDQLITDYIAQANVVIPKPNPKFDPKKFDPAAIGVQQGGLKMPPKWKPQGKPNADPPKGDKPAAPADPKQLLGWSVRNGQVNIEGKSLRASPANANLLLTHARLRADGPVHLKLRIKTPADATGKLQWRMESQDKFPKNGQTKSFKITGGEWQELSISLEVRGTLVHLRLFPTDQKQPVEIDWIELAPDQGDANQKQRWDFKAATNRIQTETATKTPRTHPNQPNVVLILADDLGYGELGSYGGPVKTPNMDRLAEQGVRCTDGYAAFPVCSPSRAAILTGRYPARFGPTYEDYFGGGSPELDPVEHPTIGQLMKDAGYRTGCFGKWNVSNLNRTPANNFGFDRWVGLHLNHDFYTHKLVANGELDMYEDGKPLNRSGIWSDTLFANEAIKFIAEKSNKPFFVFLPFQAPHDPIQDPDTPLAPRLDKKKPEHRPTLVKMIERLDMEIGRVLQALEDKGVADNTLVIVTSDNGGAKFIGRNLPLSGQKQSLLEGGIRVPMIFHWPARLPKGKTFTTPVTAMDLTATIAAAGGARPTKDKPFDGVDVVPALIGEAQLQADRPLFFRRRNVVTWKGINLIRQSAVRVGDWKLLRTYNMRDNAKYKTTLYNLKTDLEEQDDLSVSNPEKAKALSDLLDQWEKEMSETAAPFPPASSPKK